MHRQRSAGQGYTFLWHQAISQINSADWDALAQDQSPFLEWAWLQLLEESGSVAQETGWQAQHLTVWQANRLVAAAPLYIKRHSEGEFVFDQLWAQLAAKINVAYYPKLVGMSPLTPISAYRFLLSAKQEQICLIRLMQEEIEGFCLQNSLSGCHYHFLDPNWGRTLQDLGFSHWIHPGFIWENQGYQDFEDFLSCFRSNRRKNIKKERKSLASQGIKIEALSGSDIQESHLLWMYRFYVHTNQRYFPWSCKYLTQDFFLGLRHCFRHRLLLLVAYKENLDQPLGMSMLVFKNHELYGRYWGGTEGVPYLHFNLCYYEPIRWAIANRVQRYDPGMGGEHKLHRGFKLAPSYSLHRFYIPGLQPILASYLNEINQLEERRILELNQELPLK